MFSFPHSPTLSLHVPRLDVPESLNRVLSIQFYLPMDFIIFSGYRQLITIQSFGNTTLMENIDACFVHRVIDRPAADIICRCGETKVKEWPRWSREINIVMHVDPSCCWLHRSVATNVLRPTSRAERQNRMSTNQCEAHSHGGRRRKNFRAYYRSEREGEGGWS